MLQISFSKLHLTKIVTILPYFTVVNMSGYQLHYMEEDTTTDLWLSIDHKEVCIKLLFIFDIESIFLQISKSVYFALLYFSVVT